MAIFFSIKMTFFSCLGFGHNLQKVQLNRSGLVIHYARPFSTTDFLQIHNLLDFAFFAYLARLLKKIQFPTFQGFLQKHYLQIFFKIAKKRNHLEPRQFLMTILCSVNIYRTVFQCFCSSFGHVTHRTQFNTRGAHFKRNFNRFCWLKYVSNNFSQGFQKRQYCFDRTMPLCVQVLPMQPMYRLGYRGYVGRICTQRGFV